MKRTCFLLIVLSSVGGSCGATQQLRQAKQLRQSLNLELLDLEYGTISQENIEFDQYVSPRSAEHGLEHAELLFGHDNLNGGFTTDRRNNVEIGLRTRLRYPVAENEYNSNGDGTYSWKTDDCIGVPGDCKIPHWSLEWSVNTNLDGSAETTLRDYCWELGMDADPSHVKTDFTVLDPITPTPGKAAFYDHSFGTNNSTKEDSYSIYSLCIECTEIGSAQACAAFYTKLLATYNIAQNDWNFGFSATATENSLYYFDRSVPGSYVIYMRAIDCKGTGEILAESAIQVLVGGAPAMDLSQVRLPNLTSSSVGSPASNLEYSKDVTPSFFASKGAPNGGFTIDRRNGIEVGLRTRQVVISSDNELPASNIFHDNGNGIYWWGTGPTLCSNSGDCGDKTPQYNVEFAIHVDGKRPVADYCWEIGLDGDPSDDTDFLKFDPIHPSTLFPFFDHSFGNQDTQDIVAHIDDGGCVDSETCKGYYTSLINSNSVAQNSWSLESFSQLQGFPLERFDPSRNASYIVYLRATECRTDQVLAETSIQVLVGRAYPIRQRSIDETGTSIV